MSCKTEIATETQQNTSHVIFVQCLMIWGLFLLWQHLVKAILMPEVYWKETHTRKTSMQKQPKNSIAIQISDMVTDEEMRQNKKDPQNYTKKCLYVCTTIVSNSSKIQQLVRALDHYRLDILGITKTHMPYSGEYSFPEDHRLFYSGWDDRNGSEGIGIALAKRVRGSLISFVPFSSRIMTSLFS